MAVPQYRDEVLVTLTSLDPPSSFAFPDRRFFLTKEKPGMNIGRTSKRNTTFEATKNNGWFDSPVMSRDHAHLKLDVENQAVYIKDIGSLHGTFKNEQRLVKSVGTKLNSGDIIRFGIPIDRGSDRYPPCTMEARIKFGTINPEDRPKVFRVPDDSDVEDSSDDDRSIHNSTEILRNTKMRPAPLPPSPHRPTIDLTSNDQYPTSNVRGDGDDTANPLSSGANSTQEVTYVDLSSPSPEELFQDDGLETLSQDKVWDMSEGPEEGEINLSDSTDMDTESLPGDYSPSESSSHESIVSDAENNYITRDSPEVEENEFEDQDGFDGDSASELPEEMSSRENEEVPEYMVPPEESEYMVDAPNTGLIQTTHEAVEVNTTEILPSENEHQVVPGNEGNVLKGVDFMFHTQLPPIEQPKTTVPPWVQPCYVQPLRLPSISEAMPPYPPTHCAEPKTVAEMMGEKTGKYEFFAARAENKYNMISSNVAPMPLNNGMSESFSRPSDQEPISTPSIPQSSQTISWNPEKVTLGTVEATRFQVEVPKRLVPSDWTASGDQFLNSPPDERHEFVQAEAPALDETSAYQFELSKKAAACNKTEENADVQGEDKTEDKEEDRSEDKSEGKPEDKQEDKAEDKAATPAPESQPESSKRTHMEISDILEGTNGDGDQDTPSRSTKRKADEMSQLSPEEAEPVEQDSTVTEKKLRSKAAQRRFRRTLMKKKRSASISDTAAPTSSESTDAPPPKRLRRVAEVLGYAALGGVAVMSALIATAPAL